jgi:hypothetical protein
MQFSHFSPHWRCWRYVESDDDFIKIYGIEANPPDGEFPMACFMYDDDLFITMDEEEAMGLFFSL